MSVTAVHSPQEFVLHRIAQRLGWFGVIRGSIVSGAHICAPRMSATRVRGLPAWIVQFIPWLADGNTKNKSIPVSSSEWNK